MTHPPKAAPEPEGSTQATDQKIKDQFQERVARLSFQALASLIRRLLIEMGYSEVRLRRTHFKGHNSGGGWDLEATLETGLTRQKVLVQVKRLSRPVQGRCVDELRGAVLRAGAAQGLLITTGVFSPVAREAATHRAVAEVTLIDGERLADLITTFQIEPPQDSRRPNAVIAAPTCEEGASPFCECLPGPVPSVAASSAAGVTVTITVHKGVPAGGHGGDGRPGPDAQAGV